MNGVKQCGVLSHNSFAVYIHGLVEKSQQTEVGCHMSSRFTEALAYVEDITLLALGKNRLLLFSLLYVEIMLLNMILYLMEVKVNYCFSRADHRLWCHHRYWLMVKLLL